MALMLALGELQKNAGPDQRITARAEIIDEAIAQPKLTGIWQSLELKSSTTASDFSKTSRDAKFKSWLTSTGTPADSASLAFASNAPLSTTTPAKSPPAVSLWGTGTVGSGDPKRLVIANKVDITSSPGALAWAVMDEGVKARINTPYDDTADTKAMATAQLGTGKRPATEFMAGISTLTRSMFETKSASATTIQKGISPSNLSLAATQLAGTTVSTALKALAHDVTTSSVGIFTDTARGGLRQDFHLLTNSGTLPSEYSGKGIYASRSVAPSAGSPSDPQWESLSQFATLYNDTDKLTKDSNGAPLLAATAPSGWDASDVSKKINEDPTPKLTPPPGALLMPAIAKVQMLLSLTVRDIYQDIPIGQRKVLTAAQKIAMHHDWWKNTSYDYEMHMIYTPFVTLTNPYNVALEFKDLKVEFIGIPFAIQLFRNGTPLSTTTIPLEQLMADNMAGTKTKVFAMDLKPNAASVNATTSTCRLLPGQTITFSPYIQPVNWYQEVKVNEPAGTQKFWDNHLNSASKSLTSTMKGIPGFLGLGYGYSLDWLADDTGSTSTGKWRGDVGVFIGDKWHIQFEPKAPAIHKNKFTVQMSATVGGATKRVNAIELNYESADSLKNLIAPNGGTWPLRYPKASDVPNYKTAIDLRDTAADSLGSMVNVKPFALLTVQGKTANGGIDNTLQEGRFLTKPWSFTHIVAGAASEQLITEHPSNHSHEIELLPCTVDTYKDLLYINGQGGSTFTSGITPTYGTYFGSLYDIPLAPAQALAELNGANPGGSSGYLPRFAQPIGNSWAHPLITPSNISEIGPSGYNYLDHSFLLNTALYDGFYFSGLADQTGAFGSSKTSKTLASDLATDIPLNDPRMMLTPPNGKNKTDFTTAVTQTTAYKSIAAWQSMAGAFNINSTSAQAWKAMLASIHDAQSIVNQRSGTATSLTNLKTTGTGKARISRFRLPASPSAADGGDQKDAYWMGPREYSDSELQTLADNIVKQVRLRGPFLSLAEFVNRRLGTESDATTQRGALQQAIDDSNLNKSLAEASGAGFEIPAAKVANYKYKNATAGTGPSYQGAPGYLSQADILNVLGNAATARSDTFTIRGYGESRDAAGKMVATATCEAVVQRVADWIDSSEAAETPLASLTNSVNKTFGRRFKITSFRWLNSTEI
jgi:hypothetical protein